MTGDEDIRYDRSLLGVEHHVGTFDVTREVILAFSHATGEVNPLYTGEAGDSGLIAPPTFCNVFVNGMTRPDIRLEFGDTGFFGGQSIECIAPVRPGDTLDARTKLREVYAKTGRSGTMVFVVWETSFTNQRGEIVALARESYVRRRSRR